MAEFPALPLWTDAFIADTIDLNVAETGAYLLLLMVAWRTPDCSLPDDDKKLARSARCTPRQWLAVWPAIRPFWTLCDGRWTQIRLTKERNYVADKSKRQSENAQARWLKNNNTGDAAALPNECQIDAPTPTPTPIEKKERDASASLKTPPGDRGFETFWSIYPKGREGSKTKAREKYASILRRKVATADQILAGAQRYHDAGYTGSQYVKGAVAWLNAEGWHNDGIKPPSDAKAVPGGVDPDVAEHRARRAKMGVIL